jgi:hypothetical protein
MSLSITYEAPEVDVWSEINMGILMEKLHSAIKTGTLKPTEDNVQVVFSEEDAPSERWSSIGKYITRILFWEDETHEKICTWTIWSVVYSRRKICHEGGYTWGECLCHDNGEPISCVPNLINVLAETIGIEKAILRRMLPEKKIENS